MINKGFGRDFLVTLSRHVEFLGIVVLGVLPEAKNNYHWEYSQNLCGSGPNNLVY